MRRTLGRSGITVSAMGLGCWAIGGPFLLDGRPDGWGEVDDAESVRALRRAIDLGVTFFDTADVYGTGHSERVLGRALRGRRDEVVVATKFGYRYDEARREVAGTDVSPGYIRAACAASLRRLGTDHIDLYQLHPWSVPAAEADDALAALEELRREGTIRAYGWSTGDPGNARRLAGHAHGTAIQHPINLLSDAPEILALCDEHDLASVCNGPLAMGLLTGKFDAASKLPGDDVRGSGHDWVAYFSDGRPRREFLDKLGAVREILTGDGRTLAQGALAWLWARSERTIPIPGFKTTAQAEENARAMELGPLTPDQMAEIAALLTPGTAAGLPRGRWTRA
jgi:aryl-alcohol dehydrogenase-like predicted oxidoreductase